MTTKAKRYTIHDIKAINDEAGKFFFSRDTLRFFNDKVRNWGVWHVNGLVFIHHKGNGHPLAGKVRQFHPDTGEIGPTLSDEQYKALITPAQS